MTYQYLTVDICEKAKFNGGFVDQTTFKTTKTYGFDSFILDKSTALIDEYVKYIRPLFNPQCDFLLVNRNDLQFSKLTALMSIASLFMMLLANKFISLGQSNSRFKIQDSRFKIQDPRSKIQDPRSKVQDPEIKFQENKLQSNSRSKKSSSSLIQDPENKLQSISRSQKKAPV